jgi:hypothetical protein
MAGVDIAAYSAVLKNVYLPPVQEALNNATILLSRIEKQTRDLSGNSWVVPIHYGRNYAAGLGIADGGYTPTPGVQSFATATSSPKFIYGTVKFTGPAIAATKNDQGSFVRAIKSEIDGLMRDVKRAVNRQLHGDGKDALAYFVSSTNATNIVVDDGNGYAHTHLTAGQAIPVSLVDASAPHNEFADNVNITITLGSSSTGGFSAVLSTSLSTTAVVADGDYFVPSTGTGANDTSTLGRQMMGISGIISAADPVVPAGGGTLTGLHGLAVATYPWWASQIVGSDASHADLSFATMQSLFSLIATNSDYSEADIKLLLSSYQVRDKYVQLCTDERRFFNTMTLDGGFEAVTFNGKPLVPDSQCKRGRIYYLVPEVLKIFRTSDFEWMDRHGNYLQFVPGVDAYTATLVHYGDLVCLQRNCLGAYVGITE